MRGKTKTSESGQTSQATRKRPPGKAKGISATQDTELACRIHDLRVAGKSWPEIGRELSMAHSYAWGVWQKFIAERKTYLAEKIDEWKRVQLDRIDQVINLAFEDYLKSRSPRLTKIATKKPGKDGGPDQIESSVKEEQNTIGEPRYLNIINQAIAQQCKILGIGQSGVSIAVGVTSDDSVEGSDTPAKPVFVVMTSHQDVAEFEEIKRLMAAGGYNASNVIEGKLATKDGASNG